MSLPGVFFESAAGLREWLERDHARARELWVGFHKRGSGKAGLSYGEALDEALCFGWIDGVRKSTDETRYVIRFSPRKPGSVWSRVNLARAEGLKARGRMRPPGLAAFENRDPAKAGHYSYENRPRKLTAAFEKAFRAKAKGWAFFQSQPASYQRTCSWWVLSAKKEETRARRLETLIADSAKGRRVGVVPSRRTS